MQTFTQLHDEGAEPSGTNQDAKSTASGVRGEQEGGLERCELLQAGAGSPSSFSAWPQAAAGHLTVVTDTSPEWGERPRRAAWAVEKWPQRICFCPAG